MSGELGGSTAGLRLFLKGVVGFEDVKREHTEPSARLDVSRMVSAYATAMEDVSDGLAPEVQHICQASGCGAVLFGDRVPISARVREAAKVVSGDALDYALFGGEDFELVYTVPPEVGGEMPGVWVGEMREGEGVVLQMDGKEMRLERSGYDHFS